MDRIAMIKHGFILLLNLMVTSRPHLGPKPELQGSDEVDHEHEVGFCWQFHF